MDCIHATKYPSVTSKTALFNNLCVASIAVEGYCFPVIIIQHKQRVSFPYVHTKYCNSRTENTQSFPPVPSLDLIIDLKHSNLVKTE